MSGWYNAAVMNVRVALPVASILIFATLLNGCAPTAPASDAAESTMTVFAAASLAESFRALGEAFEAEHPDSRVRFNFAGSQTLRTQLQNGAAADVFASANWQQMEAVQQAGLLGNVPEYFAANRLAVATPAGSDAVQSLEDLTRPGVSIAVAAEEVPAGAYSRQVLNLLGESAEFPDGFAAGVLANVVTNETSVRGVAQKVALGEVDAGLIYETDASAAQYQGAFRIIEIPLQYNPAAQYPIASLSDGSQREMAVEFIDFVQGDAGQRILRDYGFVPPANVACPCHQVPTPTPAASAP